MKTDGSFGRTTISPISFGFNGSSVSESTMRISKNSSITRPAQPAVTGSSRLPHTGTLNSVMPYPWSMRAPKRSSKARPHFSDTGTDQLSRNGLLLSSSRCGCFMMNSGITPTA